MLHHNKKRNTGLLNEFFAHHIAKCIVDKNYDGANKAKSLYSKYFGGNTELAKENYLYNVLYNTTIKNKSVAVTLMEKVKTSCKKQSNDTLDKEKTKLIHEININLQDKDFFSYNVSDFRTQATIQVLLNNWRENKLNENISDVAKLEDSLLEHLTTEKPSFINENILEMTNGDIDSLVVSIMTEKFNEQYSEQLSEEQRKIISSYVLCDYSDSRKELVNSLENIRENTLKLINFVNENKKVGAESIDEQLSKKLIGIKNLLLTEYKDTSKINENTITFYMRLTEMKKELENDWRKKSLSVKRNSRV